MPFSLPSRCVIATAGQALATVQVARGKLGRRQFVVASTKRLVYVLAGTTAEHLVALVLDPIAQDPPRPGK